MGFYQSSALLHRLDSLSGQVGICLQAGIRLDVQIGFLYRDFKGDQPFFSLLLPVNAAVFKHGPPVSAAYGQGPGG